MSDPILAAHRILPNVYQLSHPFSPISVKDQLIRAALMAQRLIQDKELDGGSHVLVIGAGVTGVEVAANLCLEGMSVTILEKSDKAFGTQLGSKTRWLDPCQYDWPSLLYVKGSYPVEPSGTFIEWKSNFSFNIATEWTKILDVGRQLFKERLNILWNCTKFAITPIEGTRQFTVTIEQNNEKLRPVDAIIYATGFGAERNFLGDTEASKCTSKCIGPLFWGNDTLTQPDLGQPTQPRLLIMGSGDGALQDFLRAATKKDSAKDIYDVLQFPSYVQQMAHDIEAQFHRSFIWMEQRNQEHSIYDARQKAYNDLVEAEWPRIRGINQIMRHLTRDDLKAIYLAFPCNHFTAYYGLNCFLVLVVARAWQEIHDSQNLGPVLRPRLKVTDVEPPYSVNDDGVPIPPEEIFKVSFEDGKECYSASKDKGNPPPIEAEILIPRFGIIKPPKIESLWPNAAPIFPDRTRHIFPYFLHEPMKVV